MRNWFILFATTFTITTLIVSMTSALFPMMSGFDQKYVLHLTITSALLSLYMNLVYKVPIENYIVNIVLDLIVIFSIVYIAGYYIHLYPVDLSSVGLIFSLVIVIYSMITMIYHFILTKEAEQMNGKIKEWRKKHASSGELK